MSDGPGGTEPGCKLSKPAHGLPVANVVILITLVEELIPVVLGFATICGGKFVVFSNDLQVQFAP